MDPIKRQLRLLDARLEERAGLAKWLFTHSPLLPPACSLIVGIVTQQFFPSPIWLPVTLLILAPLAFVISLRFIPQKHLNLAVLTACICAAALGAIRLEHFYRPHPNDIRNLVSSQQKMATIRGIVKTKPTYENRQTWKFGRYQWTEPGCSFYLEATHIKSNDQWPKVSGTIRIQLSGRDDNLAPGDHIEMYCILSRFQPPLNPGQFDVKSSMQRRNIHLAATVKSANGIKLLKKVQAASMRKITSKIQSIASEALLGENLADDQASAILAALLLGQRSNIDTETSNAFQKTNLAHFISLSGMHLGILAATFWWMCKTAGMNKRLRAITCAAIITLYIVIVPPRAPTLRAAVICWAFCLSVLVRRKPNSINTLSIAAIALLIIKPTDVFTAGWQLSYTTVLGIILLQRPVCNWILERTTDRIKPPSAQSRIPPPLFHWSTTAANWAIQLFSTGISAWLGGAGILLYHFGTIGPLASLWTVLVFPLVWLILVLGFFKMILAFLLPTISLSLSIALVPLANSLTAFVKLLAATGISQILIGSTPAIFTIAWYTLLALFRFVQFTRPLLKHIVYATLIILIVIPPAILKFRRTHRNHLELTTLSIGHGQAIFVALPGKTNLLFDTGSLGTKDPGSRIVLPFLRHNGIDTIDTIILSHDDIDHINGIPEIVSTCKVRNIRANEAVIQKASTSSMAGYLSYCLKNLNHSIAPLTENLNLKSPAKIKFLYPTQQTCNDPSISNNDKSQVILIEFANRKILITSDIELYAQEQLLQLYPDLKVDVLIMPHHGSTTNLTDNFAQKLNAQTIIISCSRTRQPKAYKPPKNIKAFYTPTNGAIKTIIKADGTISTTGFVIQSHPLPGQ